MKIHFIVLIVIILAIVIIACRNKNNTASLLTTTSNQHMTLENKLKILESCGLKLSEPFSVNDLLLSWDRSQFEEVGFDLVLVGLGMTEENEPWRYHSVNLWHFDTECIEDHGDYKRIVERMSEMTQGSMVLENVKDFVDLEEGKAWFSFLFQGKVIKIDCKIDNDWVDENIFAKFVELLNVSDSSKIFIYYDLGGQDCIIGCVTKNELKKLNSSGIKFVPLS